jgi:hypothetical protein
MLLIYTETITPRLEYIAEFIFGQILQVEFSLTTNLDEFNQSVIPKLNYSNKQTESVLNLRPSSLLFETGLMASKPTVLSFRGAKVFFPSPGDSILPFDPLAAAFYLVSRMEEYSEKERTKYNCFPAAKSILAENGLLRKPVVNLWARMLADKISEHYPAFKVPPPRFDFISTIDIDNAWAYTNKGFVRGLGAMAKDVFLGRGERIAQRIQAWFYPETDPYNSYGLIESAIGENAAKTRFFFLLGDHKKYDKNISFRNRQFRQLIKNLTEKYPAGIHPSYFSGTEPEVVVREVSRLETIVGKKITASRQHFLRIFFPKTYQNLAALGIDEDYSMGYSSDSGFRAGTSTPFFFYDLEKEQQTKLRIFPFQVMDVTLGDYMKLTPGQAKAEIESLMDEVARTGGTFVSVWHNETLTDSGQWKGFREVFQFVNEKGFALANG